jgi:hypothetical protein
MFQWNVFFKIKMGFEDDSFLGYSAVLVSITLMIRQYAPLKRRSASRLRVAISQSCRIHTRNRENLKSHWTVYEQDTIQ